MTDNTTFLDLTAPGVAGLRPYEPGKPVEELERELGISGSVKLASNESPLGPGPGAAAAVQACLGDLSRYPDGNGFVLKQALAQRHGVNAEQITLGNGSNEILELITRTFVTPTEKVVFSEHGFAVYPIVTQAVGAQAVVVPACRSAASGLPFGHDLDGFVRAIDEDTRVVFVANPNNPTGTWLTADALEAFIASVPVHVLAVIDEAYFDYARDALGADTYPDATRWVARYPNLIVTRTFSKAFGLAGLRVGYGISCPDVAELLNRVRQPFNVNSLGLAAARAALDDAAHLAQALEVNRTGMTYLTEALESMGLRWIPSVGNFVCVHVGSEAASVYQALLREGVIVRPVANYGLPQHLRVTIGLPEENARFVTALQRVL
jgi:histidinol-phosphate aminotransferase